MGSVKELIEEVANQNVSLAQSLMKAKVIAKQANDDVFYQWVSVELNGYAKTATLPQERKIKGQVYLTESSSGELYTFQVTFGADIPLDIKNSLTSYSCYDSIPTILSHLSNYSELTMKVALSDVQLAVLSYPYQQEGRAIAAGYYAFPIGAVHQIIDRVRQRLLDSLIDVADDSHATGNIQATNTVINNIYGDGNDINVAVGAVVHQQVLSNDNRPND